MPDFSIFTEYGLAGVCIALIVLLAFVILKVFNLMGNHLESNIKTMQKIDDNVDQNTKATEANTEVLREMKNLLVVSFRNNKRSKD